MKKKLTLSLCFLAAFVLWTILVGCVNVQPIGPQGSSVGFAAVNGFVHRLTGVNWSLYAITDWLSLVPLGFVAGFGIRGLCQWVHRKHIRRVDRNLLLLGGFYLIVLAVFLLFEVLVINYRPVLIEGILEASYPSSTTMLVLCIMPTAATRMRNRPVLHCCIWVFTILMVIGRILSGVHWITDIIGGIFLSASLVYAYCALSE